ncbi:MAG: hypothetical protein HYY24_04410 [Verrucomicrobia bacterium]|nr:hypothetical protein [Verrucomicrobiota bacterium]
MAMVPDQPAGAAGRLNLEEFQQQVLVILAAQFPTLQFRAGDRAGVILVGESQMGLGNLYARYQQGGVAGAELKDLVCAHFGNLVDVVPPPDGQPLAPWEDARAKLRPQLMPVAFTRRVPLVHFPFHAGLAIGLVLDEPNRYAYVRADDRDGWGKSADELYALALRNLDAQTHGVKIHAFTQPERLMVIETKDGYDAARLLLPELRARAAKHLGEPFLAGVPNRDFLIMWSRRCSATFQSGVRQQLQADSENQPHPLTSVVFEAAAAFVRPATGA